MRDLAARCVGSLLASADDDSETVRDQVIASLRILAGKNLADVLQACCNWLTKNKHGDTSRKQRLIVCRAIVEILKSHATPGSIADKLLADLVTAAFAEMTAINEISDDWANEACTLYVELCDLAPATGMKALLEAIPSGQVPHYFVLKAASDFAALSPLRFLPFLKEVLAKLLPILSMAKQDNHRAIFSYAMGMFCDAI